MVWIADKISNCSLMIPVQGNNPFPLWSTYNGAGSVAELKLVDIILSMKEL